MNDFSVAPSKLLQTETIAGTSAGTTVPVGSAEKFMIIVSGMSYWNWGPAGVTAAATNTLIPCAGAMHVVNKGGFGYIRIYNPGAGSLYTSVLAVY